MRALLLVAVACASAAALAGCATGDTANDGTTDGAPSPGADGGGLADGSADGTIGSTADGAQSGDPDGAATAPDATADGFDAADAAPTCTEVDAGCVTANPGACAAGVLLCDGGAPVCQPIATTQPCYSGPPATKSVGVCHGGTQTCTGSLGACTGEVDPAPRENCFNTLDDDCNGKVNDGCPSALALGADRPLAGAGGAGGGLASLHCPSGAFVTRVDSWFDDPDKHASGVSIYCATPTLTQGASTYTVTLVPNTPAPYATQTGANSPTNERHDDCGITGLTAITYTVGLGDTFVEGLGNHCGTSPVTLAADDTITFAFATTGDTGFNDFTGATGTFFNQACNANEVIVGFNLHKGSWLDNIQPICAALTVTYIP